MLLYEHNVIESKLLLDSENIILARYKDACFKVFIAV